MYIPSKELPDILKNFNIVSCDADVVHNSLIGPTNDFEDNVQLHSAVKQDCDFFITNDKNFKTWIFW